MNNPNYYSPHDEKWKSLENTPDAYGAIKDYFTSAKRISPTQFQLVVDSDSDMIVHTVIHLGRIAVDIGSMVALYSVSGGLAAASNASSIAKGVEASKNFLGEAATGGISLASDVATMIKDISEYSTEGKIIVTLGPESKKLSDLIEWIVL